MRHSVPSGSWHDDSGAKIPINGKVDLSIDTRFLSSINDINGSYIIKSFNQGVQFLLGLNIRLSK